MRYTEGQFLRLMEAITDQGGEHLHDEMCSAVEYELSGEGKKKIVLPGCGNNTIFEIPYAATDARGDEIGMQPVKVCAVDDNVGLWPRFTDQVFE